MRALIYNSNNNTGEITADLAQMQSPLSPSCHRNDPYLSSSYIIRCCLWHKAYLTCHVDRFVSICYAACTFSLSKTSVHQPSSSKSLTRLLASKLHTRLHKRVFLDRRKNSDLAYNKIAHTALLQILQTVGGCCYKQKG